MKKTLSIIALSVMAFGMVSCKKENKETAGTETAATTTDSTAAAPAITGDSAAVAPASEQATAAASASKQPLTTVALSGSNFDFGKIKKGEKVQHVYEITNTGSNPLVISEVKPGCGCTVPDFTKEPIMPGKKGKITLHFDSTNFEGNVSKFADVFANVEKMPIKLTFTANIQP